MGASAWREDPAKRRGDLAQRSLRLRRQGLDFRPGLVKHGAHFAACSQHPVLGGAQRTLARQDVGRRMPLRVRARGGLGRGLQLGLIHGFDRRVQLGGQHQELAARFDHDAAHVATRGGHDFQRFVLGSRPHLVAQPDQLVRLG